ncbi:MAG: hypothetical protein AAF216_07110 [Pseudomonadota bacterium]
MRSLLLALTLLAACTPAEPPSDHAEHRFADRYSDWPAYEGVALWQLYRTEVGGEGEVRLATFDSLAGKRFTPGFNQNACERAADAMMASDPYDRRHWCEVWEPRPRKIP